MKNTYFYNTTKAATSYWKTAKKDSLTVFAVKEKIIVINCYNAFSMSKFEYEERLQPVILMAAPSGEEVYNFGNRKYSYSEAVSLWNNLQGTAGGNVKRMGVIMEHVGKNGGNV